MKTRRLASILLVAGFLVISFYAFSCAAQEPTPKGGCTTIIVGKDASANGSTMIAYTCDYGSSSYATLNYHPAKDYEPNAKRSVYYWGSKTGSIPQVDHTYAYFGSIYGIMNEHGLIMGESTAAAKTKTKPKPDGKPLLSIMSLSKIALERCKTAREAIKLMGKLGVKYGFAGWGENLTIADGEETWLFEMVSTPDGESAVWVAERVPDDEIAVASNIFTIREIDFDHKDQFMYSDNIKKVAKEQGWWEPGEPLDFLKVYTPGEFGHPYYSLRRIWRVLDLVAPSKDFDPWVENDYTKEYPFSVKPDEKVSKKGLFSILRDHYEGTQFDLTEGLAAGPFGTPVRYASPHGHEDPRGAWERAISVYRCAYSYVVTSRENVPGETGTVLWWGPDAPHSTVYVPFFAGITKVPEAYSSGSYENFSRDSAWWAFNFVSNWANLKYSYMIKDIHKKQQKIENQELEMQPAIVKTAKQLYEKDPTLARQFLTDYCVSNANEVVKEWWNFSDHLIKKYSDGDGFQDGVTGYPTWWLEKVGFDEGPTSYKPEEEKK